MLVSMISHLLSAWFAFLLPCFATWKALAHRPVSEPELEHWAKYWTVVGAFIAFEYVAEWFISWVPFYWETKTVFLLFLSLPQTQGSTWIFHTYLHPYFAKNEASIDAGIAAAQSNALTFVQTRLTALWQILWDLATKGAPAAQGQAQGTITSGVRAAPNPLDMAKGLWNSFGPSVLGAFQQPPREVPPRPSPAASSSSFHINSSADIHSRAQSGFDVGTDESRPASSHSSIPPAFPEPQFH
ncbi:hypothetical protein CERSUDRAFT_90515 [Gelatoporia subvermispora B]|uniref:Protein YOP1 n=1 Tax=Ceriporiopsis subvermispora (strain B) TaxID=914234 RepID=M2RSP0_CERS8|nr:hypothetical protein CERSUDRAFT_90515 [Gelatoporia subvermispora B]